jgi:hypothetical protein
MNGRLADECRCFGALGDTRRIWRSAPILLSKNWGAKAGVIGRPKCVIAVNWTPALVLEVILMISLLATTRIVLWRCFASNAAEVGRARLAVDLVASAFLLLRCPLISRLNDATADLMRQLARNCRKTQGDC